MYNSVQKLLCRFWVSLGRWSSDFLRRMMGIIPFREFIANNTHGLSSCCGPTAPHPIPIRRGTTMVDGTKELAIQETATLDIWYLEPITLANTLRPSPVFCCQVCPGNRVIERGPSEDALSKRDPHNRLRRFCDPEMMLTEFIAVGLRMEFFGCEWMKQTLNCQLQAQWSPVKFSACMTMGERYPDIAAELVVSITKAAA